jgi:allantoinase
MADFDLIIRAEQDIGILEERIAALTHNLSGSAREEIDATNLAIFSGAIDAHVHFNEPGRTDWEGFETGSRAAAAGGTTTVFEMPLNAHPPTVDGPNFDTKRAAAEASSAIDFGLWGGLIPGNLTQLETLRDRGVVGLKAFMCNSGIGDFPAVDAKTLREGMRIAADLNMLVAVHAESEAMTSLLTGQKLAANKTAIRDFLESRPTAAELEAIQVAINLAGETGCRLHIVHVSCVGGVALVVRGRETGIDVTCETCPHYLVLTEDDPEQLGAVAKCAPPLRSREEQEALWHALDAITTIGSDHSPCPPEMKKRDNFFEVWGGISGCQHLLPLLIDASLDRPEMLAPKAIARLTSEQVAARFGIREKGGVAVGKDADLALVDLNATTEISEQSLRYRHRQSPYLGRRLRGRIVRTILRGQTVYQDGKITPAPKPKLVRPE